MLQENALEAWATTIHYCDEIMAGKATLSNKKLFVVSLQNAIELFCKQHMLNINDYRVASAKKCDATGNPLKDYFLSDDLNGYFLSICNKPQKINSFRTIEFNKIIEYFKSLFQGNMDENNVPYKTIQKALSTLQRLRNSETHFFVSGKYFVTDAEFLELYNLMVYFYKLMVSSDLLPYWGDAYGYYKQFSFDRTPLTAFSLKEQLKKSDYVTRLKECVEREIYPVGAGDEAYEITEDIINHSDAYAESDFDELWAYVQMLLDEKMLIFDDQVEEGAIDGELVSSGYREYRILIDLKEVK